MPDYSEFPTTPTAWQEQAWQEIRPLSTEDPERPPQHPDRKIDVVALVAGLFFVVVALVLMAGAQVPWFLADGGLVWLFLIGGGVALLVSELRKAQRRR